MTMWADNGGFSHGVLPFQARDAQMCATHRSCYDTRMMRVKLQYFTFVRKWYRTNFSDGR